jgi:hypothetical protein
VNRSRIWRLPGLPVRDTNRWESELNTAIERIADATSVRTVNPAAVMSLLVVRW